MDRLENYRSIIKRLLEDYRVQGLESDEPGTDRILIADDSTDNYLLLNLGWWKGKRISIPNSQLLNNYDRSPVTIP